LDLSLHRADTRKTIRGASSLKGLTAKQPKRDFARRFPEGYQMSEKRDANAQWHRSTPGEYNSLPLRQSGQGAAIKDKLPRIITKKELRLIVPYSPQHILRLEKRGKFPSRVQLGARRVGWYLHEVNGWLQQRLRGTTMVPFRKKV
jgi:prophage regulatory protein